MPCETGTIRCRVLVKLFAFWFLCCGFSAENFFWQKLPDGIKENRIRNTALLDDAGNTLIAVTDRAIYRARNYQSLFQHVLAFEAGEQRAYSIYAEKNWIAVATAQGLWESKDFGENWERTFNPAQALHRRCYCVFKSGDMVFVGTAQGLFRRNIDEIAWYRHKGTLSREPVFDIIGNDKEIFFAAASGIYCERLRVGFDLSAGRQAPFSGSINGEPRSLALQETTRIFAVAGNEYGADTDTGINIDGIYDNRFIRAITFYDGKVFAVTKAGIWEIENEEWKGQRFSSVGIPLSDVEDIEVVTSCLTSHGHRAPDFPRNESSAEPEPVLSISQGANSPRFRILFLATQKGAFTFFNNQWIFLYKGISTNDIRDIESDWHGNVVAATDEGLFQLKQNDAIVVDYQIVREEFLHEPSVRDVQEMVIRYADVGKEKIDTWKNQARSKAFIPSVSLDFDRDVSDLYHWNTGASPDELQKGEELLDWGVSFRWDLADVVWSTDQTSIDSRAKLMVELRDDLLNQATRIYFERRRLQIELLQMSSHDPLRWQAEMRIEELTAGLDGMTGGQFNQSIN